VNKVLIGIPTYNCERQIGRVLETLRGSAIETIELHCEVRVIDNRSEDSTIQTAMRFHKNSTPMPIKVYLTEENNSLGGTIKVLFNMAEEEGFNYVVILHGDDQAHVPDLMRMLREIGSQKREETLLGSRFMTRSKLIGYSRKRIIGNLLLNACYSIASGRYLSDLGSGLNIYRVKDLADLGYQNYQNSLAFNYQLILGMAKSKKRFTFVPITWKETDQKSNANNIRIFMRALRILYFYVRKLDIPINGGHNYGVSELTP
jgi:dolichol-phosphate mannosyltransferase